MNRHARTLERRTSLMQKCTQKFRDVLALTLINVYKEAMRTGRADRYDPSSSGRRQERFHQSLLNWSGDEKEWRGALARALPRLKSGKCVFRALSWPKWSNGSAAVNKPAQGFAAELEWGGKKIIYLQNVCAGINTRSWFDCEFWTVLSFVCSLWSEERVKDDRERLWSRFIMHFLGTSQNTNGFNLIPLFSDSARQPLYWSGLSRPFNLQ